MTYYYVDSTTGSDSDNGTTFDLAWATMEHALETGGLSAGDVVWIRPVHSEIPIADICPVYSGSASQPIKVMGWARAAIPDTTITQADFTNGNRVIDNVVGITPSRTNHTNRYITAPDGKQYHITAVIWEAGIDGMASGSEFAIGEILTNVTQTKKGKVWGFADNTDTTGTLQYVRDSATAWVNNDNINSSGGGDAEIDVSGETAVGFIISQEYVGTTVTDVNGKFQIEEDPDYDLAQAIDDSTWTIKKTDWDSQSLPVVDFDNGAFQIYFNIKRYWQIKNLEFKDSADSLGLLYLRWMQSCYIEGCLFKQSVNDSSCLRGYNTNFFSRRLIIEGKGSGTDNRGIYNAFNTKFQDVAIFNCGDNAICSMVRGDWDNVNLGIEMANGDNEIFIDFPCTLQGHNIALGGTNGYFAYYFYSGAFDQISIGNYQKILGNHYTKLRSGYYENIDVGDTDAPSAASPAGSTTDLFSIHPNVSGLDHCYEFNLPLIRWKIWAPASAETYTVYIQNNIGATLNDTTAKDDITLKLTYIDSVSGTKHIRKEILSTEIDILDRADDTDWDSLTIASHTPAVAGWAVLELYIGKYSSSGQIYVDPKYV